MIRRSLILCLFGATIGYADTPALQTPEKLRALAEVEGVVQSIDLGSKRLTVQDAQDHQWEMKVKSDTAITGQDNRQLALNDLAVKDYVRVYYMTKDMTARQIDRMPPPVSSVIESGAHPKL